MALTRAREKIILVGSAANLTEQCRVWSSAARLQGWALPPSILLSAQTYLDWLGPALTRHESCDDLRSDGDQVMDREVAADPSSWQVFLYQGTDFKAMETEAASALETFEPLLEPEEPLPDDLVATVKRALSWHYQYKDAALLPAKVSVSELKGRPTMSSATEPKMEEGLKRFLGPCRNALALLPEKPGLQRWNMAVLCT